MDGNGTMRVRFKRDFDWRPPEHRGLTILTARGGDTKLVRRAMGEAAVAEGAGDEVDRDGKVIPPPPKPDPEPDLEETEDDYGSGDAQGAGGVRQADDDPE